MEKSEHVYVLHQFEQRTEEWRAIRLGRVGGSEAIGLTTPARMKSMIPLKLAEMLTGEDQGDDFVSAAMQQGIDNEPLVCEEYEKREFVELSHNGYVENKSYKYLGISPDGLVFNEDWSKPVGAIEIKCPQPKAHIACILEGKVPATYRPQIAHLFFVIKHIEWVDFISYNAKITTMPYYKIRVTRADYESEINRIEKGYTAYESEIEAGLKKLKQL